MNNRVFLPIKRDTGSLRTALHGKVDDAKPYLHVAITARRSGHKWFTTLIWFVWDTREVVYATTNWLDAEHWRWLKTIQNARDNGVQLIDSAGKISEFERPGFDYINTHMQA